MLCGLVNPEDRSGTSRWGDAHPVTRGHHKGSVACRPTVARERLVLASVQNQA